MKTIGGAHFRGASELRLSACSHGLAWFLVFTQPKKSCMAEMTITRQTPVLALTLAQLNASVLPVAAELPLSSGTRVVFNLLENSPEVYSIKLAVGGVRALSAMPGNAVFHRVNNH